MSIEITDEKKREAMDALGRALDVAMYQTLAASVPACGAFGAIAQDLDFAFPILTAALSPAPQAQDATECARCCGNGEIVTDWDRYLHGEPGDRGDEGTADCPDCDGIGRHAAPQALAGEALDGLDATLRARDLIHEADVIATLRSQNDALMRERTSMIATHRENRALAEKTHAAELANLRARVAEMEARLGEDGAEWREKAAGVASEIIQNSTPPASQEGQADAD